MENKTIATLLITLIIAGSGGYMFGKSSVSSVVSTKGGEDSIRMMKEQSVSIQRMGEMMSSSGLMMQELGLKYKDEGMISAGKDLEMVGAKYMTENAKASASSDSMKKVMGN
jgi:hypothetical protein